MTGPMAGDSLFISLPDLLMLAREIDHPIKRYLKCMKQKAWAEDKGVNFFNINGDFNFYCYWRRFNYRLYSARYANC